MSTDSTEVCAVPLQSLEALLNDPLVRMVMHADGVTLEDILAAMQIAYQVISAGEPPRALSRRPVDPPGHAAMPRQRHP